MGGFEASSEASLSSPDRRLRSAAGQREGQQRRLDELVALQLTANPTSLLSPRTPDPASSRWARPTSTSIRRSGSVRRAGPPALGSRRLTRAIISDRLALLLAATELGPLPHHLGVRPGSSEQVHCRPEVQLTSNSSIFDLTALLKHGASGPPCESDPGPRRLTLTHARALSCDGNANRCSSVSSGTTSPSYSMARPSGSPRRPCASSACPLCRASDRTDELAAIPA
jgi:hypothetical protein